VKAINLKTVKAGSDAVCSIPHKSPHVGRSGVGLREGAEGEKSQELDSVSRRKGDVV